MTKIEMGKQYRTRDGKEVRIYATDAKGDQAIHGAYYCEDCWLRPRCRSLGGRNETGSILGGKYEIRHS